LPRVALLGGVNYFAGALTQDFVTRDRLLPHVFGYPSDMTGTNDAEATEHGDAQRVDRRYSSLEA
jgi:hypothetical protein